MFGGANILFMLIWEEKNFVRECIMQTEGKKALSFVWNIFYNCQ